MVLDELRSKNESVFERLIREQRIEKEREAAERKGVRDRSLQKARHAFGLQAPKQTQPQFMRKTKSIPKTGPKHAQTQELKKKD